MSVPVPLGYLSPSLAVRDLVASRDFYQRMGFAVAHGNVDEGWLVMRNGDNELGLFQDMFPADFISFHLQPGRDGFVDLLELQARVEAAGVEIDERADGPAPGFFVVRDPDGNALHVAQHEATTDPS